MSKGAMRVLLVFLAVTVAPVSARTAMDCIQHSEYKFRNLCSKNVIVAWCISEPEDGYNLEHSTVCGNHSSMYYGWMTIVPPGSSTTSFGWHGGLRWAACFSPKRPVATRGGKRFVCRSQEEAATSAPAPASSGDFDEKYIERRCSGIARRLPNTQQSCEENRHENVRRASCKALEAMLEYQRKYCAGR